MEIALDMRVFKSEDYGDTMELLRRHAKATAHLSRMICKYTPIQSEFAFMAGLMHDVGIAGTLIVLSDAKGRRKTPPDLISIWPAVDRIHPRVGELMATHWELPADIVLAIQAHHRLMIQGFTQPLAATVSLANDLAHDHREGLIPKEGAALEEFGALEADCVRAHGGVDRSGDETLAAAREGLGIDERTMEQIRDEAPDLLRAIEDSGPA